MLKLKSCPRCQGDMHANRDMYGAYNECLQCGYMQDMVEESPLFAARVEVEALKKKKAA